MTHRLASERNAEQARADLHDQLYREVKLTDEEKKIVALYDQRTPKATIMRETGASSRRVRIAIQKIEAWRKAHGRQAEALLVRACAKLATAQDEIRKAEAMLGRKVA